MGGVETRENPSLEALVVLEVWETLLTTAGGVVPAWITDIQLWVVLFLRIQDVPVE